MNRHTTIAVGITILIVMIGVGGLYLITSQKNSMIPVESITVAYSPFESSGLFLVAEDRQLFTKNGLNVTLHRSDSGAAALDDMMNGTADIAVSVSEFPFVRKVFLGAPVRAVTIMDKTEYIYIVARKDRGIMNASDLRGKRIGTAAGSIAEFYLGRFLSLKGVGIHDIHYVSVKTPLETANAIVNGDLDAAVLAQPFADQARDQLGENAIAWPAQNSQPLFALVVSSDKWIAGHPEQVNRFLRALEEAEEFTSAHPAESRTIIQRHLNLDAGYMDTVWEQNQFTLSLDQSLILAMEDEARWMISNNLTEEKTVPDFRKFINTKILEEIKPEAVRIIG
jgi:ABC-type nitrate/sulfonate/bicarbonate transport system substrate-binding protein